MIVVKAGGRVIKQARERVVESVAKAQSKVLLVHGGGDQVTETSKRMGIEPVFVTSPSGIRSRYTSMDELQVYVMVMGMINKFITASLFKAGRRAVGITGIDGPTILAERKKRIVIIDERGKKRIIDGGYTGKVVEVRTEFVTSVMERVDVVVASPLAIDREEGVPLNIDGDQAAFSLASALKANVLVLLTDVEGVLQDGKVVPKLTIQEAAELSNKIGPGMNRKLMMAAEAVKAGVTKVIISSGLVEDPVGNALEGKGTVIS
ncbi:acetylaminoadipate kinase [Sulfodiicoccus acidiphilus]|uniref:[LysW]-aminoadipate/[LysW]-glutamate kinase n=1 Tax=Sulfodiicoccus acidiphilus TaxID=1670455 RepID=A0A348B2Q4_9CREN|nr:[LysW]-aminoadipate/[LysW]-glutamate kinase [Sulfodiicoccus acidiphilus]BBD72456.1 acetylaminoadipate kinase [Sulfodiicoccus acidiphilus]GGT97012.1 acetylaminoadipate kinase [Sulfodiicoccus acidiphilus]